MQVRKPKIKGFSNKGEYLEIMPEQSGLPFSIFIETAESRKKGSSTDKRTKKRKKVVVTQKP